MSKPLNIKKNLMKRRILIVEDDHHLTHRVQNEFDRYGSEVTIKHTIESGLIELKENGSIYDLIIVDVRLPATEEDYNKIEEIQEQIKECNEVLVISGNEDIPDSKESEEVIKARGKRNLLLERINSFLHEDGGVEMVSEWVGDLGEAKHSPILYLSAVNNIDVRQNGIKAPHSRNVKWLIKPVAMATLIEEVTRLISETEVG